MIPSRAIPSLLIALASAGCAGNVAGPDVAGRWGGVGVALEVGPDGGTIELDCAHGRLDPFTLVDDRFETTGTWAREGGPARIGEVERAVPAVYSGEVAGSLLRLEARVEGFDETIGPFTLERGKTPILRKCL